MTTLNFTKPEHLVLKNHSEYADKWLGDRIVKD